MDDVQLQRIARNEARFRDLNERITDAIDELAAHHQSGVYPVLCECAVASCEEMLQLAQGVYEHVRSDPAWFVVAPEHVAPAAEVVVTRESGYWIVQKVGTAGRVARELADD